jgi:hypothetical protein
MVLCSECDNHLWSVCLGAAVVHQQVLQASLCHKTCCNRSNAICLDRVAPPGAPAPLPAQLVHVSRLREVSHPSHKHLVVHHEICRACCLVAFARLHIGSDAGHPISCCVSCACRADACAAPGQVVRVHRQEAGGPLISGSGHMAIRMAVAGAQTLWTALHGPHASHLPIR